MIELIAFILIVETMIFLALLAVGRTTNGGWREVGLMALYAYGLPFSIILLFLEED